MSVTIQRGEALRQANAVRTATAEFKRAMHGDRSDAIAKATRMLLEDASCVEGMRIYVFLEAVPFVGPARTRQILTRCHVWPLKRVGELTTRQRILIAGELQRLASKRRPEPKSPRTHCPEGHAYSPENTYVDPRGRRECRRCKRRRRP